jgi:hypothetical protein
LAAKKLDIILDRQWYQRKWARERVRGDHEEAENTKADMLVWIMRTMQMPDGKFSATKYVLLDLTQFSELQLRKAIALASRRGDVVKLGVDSVQGQTGRRNVWKVDYDRTAGKEDTSEEKGVEEDA